MVAATRMTRRVLSCEKVRKLRSEVIAELKRAVAAGEARPWQAAFCSGVAWRNPEHSAHALSLMRSLECAVADAARLQIPAKALEPEARQHGSGGEVRLRSYFAWRDAAGGSHGNRAAVRRWENRP